MEFNIGVLHITFAVLFYCGSYMSVIRSSYFRMAWCRDLTISAHRNTKHGTFEIKWGPH